MKLDLTRLQGDLRHFVEEREWEQFHSPKNLATALSVEASELLELFQWLDDAQSRQLTSEQRDAVGLELADILFYLLQLSRELDIDLDAAVERKLTINAERYPVELSRGNATKYDRRR